VLPAFPPLTYVPPTIPAGAGAGAGAGAFEVPATAALAAAAPAAAVPATRKAKKRPLTFEPEMLIRGAHSTALQGQPEYKRQVTEEYLLQKADAHLAKMRLAKAAAEAAAAEDGSDL
jgi:hypothetical protein